MNPTEKRLAAIPRFVKTCDLGSFEGILLTGSMVFGRNYTVNDDSDIDMIFIIDSSQILQLRDHAPFNSISIHDDLLAAFSEKRIDRFWLDYSFDDISFNLGIWDSNFFNNFIDLKVDILRLGTTNPVVKQIAATDAYGTVHAYSPKLSRYKSIYIKEFSLKSSGKHLSSPTYNNLLASEVLYDPQTVIAPKLRDLVSNLNNTYSDRWPEHFLTYVMRRSAPSYLAELRTRIAPYPARN